MKKIFIVLMLSFFGLVFTSCEKDDIVLSTISDVTWYSSTQLAPNMTLASSGVAISIIDLSQNALTHQWIISNNANFLKAGFTNKTGADLVPFIDDAKGKSTTDATVFIYFPTAGSYTITLKNTFKDKVTYKGTTPINSVQQADGTWLFEQVFNVTVN